MEHPTNKTYIHFPSYLSGGGQKREQGSQYWEIRTGLQTGYNNTPPLHTTIMLQWNIWKRNFQIEHTSL